ncbi:MAG TPA: hypothetical protein VFN61_08605 [Acidimicrobiales bacterium]|nr:hypothetical protein [Acidimicrobiales bacterium]
MSCLTIDCQTCSMRDTDACADCVVTFLCEAAPPGPVILAEEEYAALRLLQGGGLLPPIRHRRPSSRLAPAGEEQLVTTRTA